MKINEKEIKSIDKITKFLNTKPTRKMIHDTIDELCAHGIAKGRFQHFDTLIALLDIITSLEGDCEQ